MLCVLAVQYLFSVAGVVLIVCCWFSFHCVLVLMLCGPCGLMVALSLLYVGCAILAVCWWCELPFVLVVRSLLCVGCEVLVVCG